MASLSQTYAGETSVTILCSGLDGSHSRTRYFWWQIYRGTSLVDEKGTTSAAYSTSSSVTFSGLASGVTNYSVRCGIYDDSGYSTQLAYLTLYDVYTESPRIPDFAWTYAKTSGGRFNLTAAEWNGLWDAIELRLGRSYSHTRAYVGNTFTAAMYNEAVNAIGRGATVSRGDTITAALMNALVTNVNRM